MTDDQDDRIVQLFEDADDAWEGGRLEEAARLFREAADMGEPAAMLNIGYFYDEGLGVAEDKAEAMRWYKQAYELGEAGAASNIAVLHRETGDQAATLEWFSRAAKMGDGDAHLEVAKIYLAGEGVPVDRETARQHLEAAVGAVNLLEDDEDEDEEAGISEESYAEAMQLLASLDGP